MRGKRRKRRRRLQRWEILGEQTRYRTMGESKDVGRGEACKTLMKDGSIRPSWVNNVSTGAEDKRWRYYGSICS